jgi:hypothetical protein
VQRAGRAQQRAWAYQWAAEEVEHQGRAGHACGLFRRAGIAFMDSARHDEWNTDAKRALYHSAGYCFFRAAWCNWQPGRLELPSLNESRIRNPLTDRFWRAWEPAEIFGKAYRPADPSRAPTKAGDVERMVEAYLAAANPTNERRFAGTQKAHAYDSIASRLQELQSLLGRIGERGLSRDIYRRRRKAERAAMAARIRIRSRADSTSEPTDQSPNRLRLAAQLVASGAGNVLSRNSSSVPRAFVALAVIYCVVFPVAYLGQMVPAAGFQPDGTPRIVEAELLSLLTTVSLGSDRYVLDSAIGSLLQAAQGLSAYFALGYMIWLLTRQFDT